MKYLTLTLLLLAGQPAQAQSPGDPPETDWYTVEIVVFEQASERNAPPPADPAVPDTSNAVLIDEQLERRAADGMRTRPLLPLPDGLRILPAPEGTRALDEVRARLDRSPRYRPVLHMAWRQRVAAFSDPVPVRVHGGRELARLGPGRSETTIDARELLEGGSTPGRPRTVEEVDGTVSLVRGRYLHLNVDLVFREPTSSLVERGTVTAHGAARPYAAFPTWHIGERRQIQAGEMQYFDHRRFGVIAVALPWLALEPGSGSGPERIELPADGNTDQR